LKEDPIPVETLEIQPQEEKIEKVEYKDPTEVASNLKYLLEKLNKRPENEEDVDSKGESDMDKVMKVIQPLKDAFADFELNENDAPENSEEPLPAENKYKFNINFAWKHIQKIEKILNILYRAVTQLPETTIASLFSSSFSGKLNSNFEILLNIITGYYPFSNQIVAINIFKQIVLHTAIIRENSYEAIAKTIASSLTTDESSVDLKDKIHHKNRIGLVYNLCRHGSLLSNKIIQILKDQGSYSLITKILTFGCVCQSVKKLPGSVVSVKTTSSTNGVLACKSLLLLDRHNLDLYTPPSITQSCKKQPFAFHKQ